MIEKFPSEWCGEFQSKEAQNAIEERKVSENSVVEYKGTDALGKATEASDSHSDGQGGEVQEEKKVKRGWPKGKPRK